MPLKKLLCPLLLFLVCFAQAQEITLTNTDKILKTAQELYRDGAFKNSLRYTQRGLQLAPEYHDLRILQTRNLLALQKENQSDPHILYLLENSKDYPGVKTLLLKRVRLFDHPNNALAYIEKTEKYYSGLELQILKASFLLKDKQKKTSRDLALKLITATDLDGGQRYQLQTILNRTVSDEIGMNYQINIFQGAYNNRDSWHTLKTEYQHNFGQTAVIARVHYTNRGYDDGFLYELEAYPILSEKLYAYVNIGASGAAIFPDFRSSLSLFYNFAKIFELEAGGRLISYNDTDFFTGILGISLYQGKFLFNLRSFLGPERNEKLTQNYQGNIRYYLKSAENYLFLRVGSGISPDMRTNFTQVLENPGLETYYTNLGLRHLFWNRHIIQISAGYLTRELGNGDHGNQIIGSLGYRYQF